jgi:hypothetical protein
MALFQTVNFSIFIDMFKSMERGSDFSYSGFKALFDHLNESEEWTEFDVAEIDSTYCEMTLEEYAETYSSGVDAEDYTDEGVFDEEGYWQEVYGNLESKTTIVYADSADSPNGATIVLFDKDC